MAQSKTVPFSQLRFSADVIRKIKSYQEREREGNTIDFRTPFYSKPHGRGNVPILNTRISGVNGRIAPDRMDVFTSMEETGVLKALSELGTDIQEFEASFKPKVSSSRSIVLPWQDRVNGLMNYYSTPKLSADTKNLENAVKMAEQMIRKYIPESSLRPISLDEAMKSLPTTTNWGAPYFLEGKSYKYDDKKNIIAETDNRARYLVTAQRIIESIKSGRSPKEEDIAFWLLWRGQEGNDQETKQRIIWGEAHGVSIIGSRLRPFIDAESRLPWRSALVSQEKVDKHVAESFNSQLMYGFDASGFDYHINKYLLLSASNIILKSFTLNKEDYVIMEWYFKTHILTSPILTPDGLVLGREDNMPSGTTFTNTLDSIVNLIAAIYVSMRLNKSITVIEIQGDDAVYQLSGLDNSELNKLSDAYSELGFEVNMDKQWLKKDSVSYLKRLHVRNKSTSYRSYTWVMIGLCNMERAKGWKEAMYSARAITQTSNLSPEYPGYNAFMKWASEGDFYGLGVKLKGGSLEVLQAAGGVTKVAQRLGFDSFAANQQGLERLPRGKVAIKVPDLNTAKWVAQQHGNA